MIYECNMEEEIKKIGDDNCFQECSLDWKPYTDEIFLPSEYTCVYMKTNVGHCNPIYKEQ